MAKIIILVADATGCGTWVPEGYPFQLSGNIQINRFIIKL